MYRGLLAEGERMSGIRTIELESGKKIHFANTLAASPHTAINVRYEDFCNTWRGINENHGNHFPEDNNSFMIFPDGSLPDYVPLHMILFAFIEDESGIFTSLDPNDMSSPYHENESGQIDFEDIRNKFKLNMTDEELKVFFNTYHEIGDINRETLLKLYNNNFRVAYSLDGNPENSSIPPKKVSDILQGFAYGHGGPDPSKGLEKNARDGLGRGPMSTPTLHAHFCIHLTLEEIDKLNLGCSSNSMDSIVGRLIEELNFKENLELFLMSPNFFSLYEEEKTMGGVLRRLFENVNIYDIMKMIDPYASLIYDALMEGSWLTQKADQYFRGINGEVENFVHDVGDSSREFRSVEGMQVRLPYGEDVKPMMYSQAVKFIGTEIAPLWADVRRYVEDKIILSEEERWARLESIKEAYGLPENTLSMIDRLRPTEKQLNILLERDNLSQEQEALLKEASIKYEWSKRKILAQFNKSYIKIIDGEGNKEDLINVIVALQKLQLYDTHFNKGHNIPGVPGFFITHNKLDDGGYNLMIGFLESQKGGMEAWTGSMVVRPAK